MTLHDEGLDENHHRTGNEGAETGNNGHGDSDIREDGRNNYTNTMPTDYGSQDDTDSDE